MSSRPNEYPRASTALAVLGLTIQVAVAATDGIPIVKQVLAVVARIVTLAEDIEKRRDALHQLAETARTLGKRISAVTVGRELGGQIVLSIKAIHCVLRSIETLFENHRAKKPLHRALSDMFTTSKWIDVLKQDLSRATQQFLLVAAIDTSARVQDNAQYIGKAGIDDVATAEALTLSQFRHIRDCDVKNPVIIMEHQRRWSEYRSQFYSAEVEGSVCIIRCFDRNPQARPDARSSWDEWRRQEVIEHDRCLEQLS